MNLLKVKVIYRRVIAKKAHGEPKIAQMALSQETRDELDGLLEAFDDGVLSGRGSRTKRGEWSP